MDIKQSAAARALLTLGKDMTFRDLAQVTLTLTLTLPPNTNPNPHDLAQGAYRMRGIGKGQTITMLAPPTVLALVEREVAKGSGKSAAARALEVSRLPEPLAARRPLRDVAAWLHVNSMRSEAIQFHLLCEQVRCALRSTASPASPSPSRPRLPLRLPSASPPPPPSVHVLRSPSLTLDHLRRRSRSRTSGASARY